METGDGGFLIGAHTTSFGQGAEDICLVKTDANGNFVWGKAYGSTGSDTYTAFGTLHELVDGYAFVANTESFGAGSQDFLLIKTNKNGDVECNYQSVAPFVEVNTSLVAASVPTLAVSSVTQYPAATVSDSAATVDSVICGNDPCVQDTIPPSLICPSDISTCSPVVAWSPPVATENCSITLASSHASGCLLYTSPSPRDITPSRMPSSA